MVAHAVAGLPDVLLSKGRTSFTAGDAVEMTGVADVYPGLKRLVASGRVFSPARGVYVPIPPVFRSWRSIPAVQFITVIIELSQEGLLDSDALARSASGYSLSAVRRVGWILNHFADLDLADRLRLAGAAPTMLDPNGRRRGRLDPKWGVIVNAEL